MFLNFCFFPSIHSQKWIIKIELLNFTLYTIPLHYIHYFVNISVRSIHQNNIKFLTMSKLFNSVHNYSTQVTVNLNIIKSSYPQCPALYRIFFSRNSLCISTCSIVEPTDTYFNPCRFLSHPYYSSQSYSIFWLNRCIWNLILFYHH